MKHKIVYNNTYGGFSLSKEAMLWMMDHGHIFEDYTREEIEERGKFPRFYPEIERHNPILVQCVEELGEKAGSNLSIQEIDCDMYRIDDYDGLESVYTPDTTDWIIIK